MSPHAPTDIDRSAARSSGWFRAAALLTVLLIAFGVYVRFTDLRDVFCHSPDELAEIMPGVRLHALPVTNLRDPIRYNFIQSMFYSQHGLGDVSFYYLASGLLSLVGLPVSERWLSIAGGVTNLAFILVGCVLASTLLGSRITAWAFAVLVLASPFYVFVSRTGWARLTWTPLVLMLVILCQRKAMDRRGVIWPSVFWMLAGFAALTDGFIMLPIVPVAALLAVPGRLMRDRVFLAGMLAIALGLVVDVAIGLGARRRGTDLTMIGYVLLRGGRGSLVPTLAVVAAWLTCIDAYFPFRGAWVLVVIAWVVAARDGLRGRMIGIVAVWWLLASFGVIRYAAAIQSADPAAVPGWLNTYYLAPPSFFLVAWLTGRIVEGGAPFAGRASGIVRRTTAAALTLILSVPMAVQAHTVAFSDEPAFGLRLEQLLRHTEVPLSACKTVKAAAFYIRSHQSGIPYVFHLSSDTSNVYLGHFAEFYDGLSYGRSSRPEDPNHLLDFGSDRFGRHVPPWALYRPYGVTHFDYYIDFVDDRDRDGVKPPVIKRLLMDGARVVATIHDGGRVIGRVYSFHDESPVDLEYRDAAASWDRRFGRAGTLLQQPLAGTAYHFGYNWKVPEP